jgi:hypothetical protein
MSEKKTSSTTAKANSKGAGITAAIKASPEDRATSVSTNPNQPDESRWWAAKEVWGFEVKGRPDLTRLKTIILTYAGVRFQRNDVLVNDCPPELTKRLIEEGRFFPGEHALFFPCLPNECHGNAMLLGSDSRAERWTGFALANEGGWTSHSWVLRKRDGRLIETTSEGWRWYFGVREPVGEKDRKLYASLPLAQLPALDAIMNGPTLDETTDRPPA